MERQLWKAIVQLLGKVFKTKGEGRWRFSTKFVVEVWMWSVLHDRPVSWACNPENWPPHERRRIFPSNTTMSRRLRTQEVQTLLKAVEEQVLKPHGLGSIVWMMDGKPLTISGCSKDRQAGYGRATGGKAKGYKIHALIGENGTIAEWRVAPMNKDERVMGRRLLLSAQVQGYVLADSNYDSNKLHQICDSKGNTQLVTPRRYGKTHGHGHRKQTRGRMRSKELLENPFPEYGVALMKLRDTVERFYGSLTNWGGGLTHLPPWARTHRRVHRWVQAKLVLNAIRKRLPITTYNV